ncbi:MAG TPA: hypothetical protein VHY83_02605 [Solirubrobacteraceae bacterium]|jgi:hypothetical protein|nr:hypothetical protein [Solirubrobacteraceae bacterium]
MSAPTVPLASFLEGAILTLVIPLAFVIVVTCWYVIIWRRGMGER